MAVAKTLGAGRFGNLDELFAGVKRPHMLQQGGWIKKYTLGGMVAAANRLERAHFPYRWGGGHQGTPAPFGPMDCSGAVSYVLQRGGVRIPTAVSGALMRMGQAGPGLVTVFANPAHTFMRIAGRYFGTSRSNPGGGAGWFPDPGGAYRSRFAVRQFGPGGGGFDLPHRVVSGGTPLTRRLIQGAINKMGGPAIAFSAHTPSALVTLKRPDRWARARSAVWRGFGLELAARGA